MPFRIIQYHLREAVDKIINNAKNAEKGGKLQGKVKYIKGGLKMSNYYVPTPLSVDYAPKKQKQT
ncbi:hypothetical protein [Sporomusa malonica]|uniref:hypothetical protein n=1 Tax=Sporomusa malonica TaxID=112901 RepID=UPI0009FD6C5C|nr:hypothetical protein [Sporomusa malonica]